MSSDETTTPTSDSMMGKFIHHLETHRFGTGAFLVLTCLTLLGAVSSFGGLDLTIRVTLCIIAAMAVIVPYLALLPMRIVLATCAVSLVIDAIVFFAAFG